MSIASHHVLDSHLPTSALPTRGDLFATLNKDAGALFIGTKGGEAVVLWQIRGETLRLFSVLPFSFPPLSV